MRSILSFLVLFAIVSAYGQDTVNDSLRHILKGEVRSSETQELLENAEVKIISTDGSSNLIYTDSSGYFESDLPPNQNFRVVVHHPKYLTGVGKETTKNLNESKVFAHLYELKEIEECSGLVPLMLYNKNQIKNPFNPEEGEVIDQLYALLKDNPMLIVDLKGYRDKAEKRSTSLQRAEWAKNYLIAKGLRKERLVTSDGGISTEIPNSVKKRNHQSEILHNRILIMSVIGQEEKN